MAQVHPFPRRKLAAGMLAALLIAHAALADESGDAPDEITVTGSSIEETVPLELEKYGNRLHVLSSEDIEVAGFDDLGQTLQMAVPGLFVAPRSGAFDYMSCSLQGSRCEDILWLIDGVRINNRLYNTTGPLDTVPANIVERVEVLYGGQGIFYGTQSVAGVVNVVTKNFSREPAGSVEVGLGSDDGYHLNGDYRASFGDNQVVLYASVDRSDGYQPFADADYQPSATDRERGYEVFTAGAKYARRFGFGGRLTLLYQNTSNEVDNLVPYGVAVRNNARDENLVTAKWDQSVGDNVDFYLKAFYHDWDTHWDHIVNDTDPSGELTGAQTVLFRDTFWGFEDYGFNASARVQGAHGLEYAAGYDYQRFRGQDDVWLIEDRTESAQAVYAQVRTSDELLANTNLSFGVRHNSTSGNTDATVWNLAGKHAFTESLYARATLGTSFRLPDAEELWLRDCCEVGNPDLDPERGRNVELAVGGSSAVAGGLQWELIGFARDVDDLIAIDFDNPDFPDGRYENFDTTVDFSGWELFLAWSPLPDLSLSFDYVDSRAEAEGSSEQIPEVPESIAKIGLDYRPGQGPFELNLSFVRVGDVYDVVGDTEISHGNYSVADLAAAYFLDGERHHRIGVRLENALDETYATAAGRAVSDLGGSPYVFRYLGPPRSLHVTYRYTF